MKYIKPIFLCIVVGITMGLFLYSGYEHKKDILPVFFEGTKVHFFKLGTYDTEPSMTEATKNISNYIYLSKDGKFSVYLGMCIDDKNIEKIKEYYKALGYIVDVESFDISSKPFIEILKQYDVLLSKATDQKVMENILNGILSKYEELVESA